MIWFHPQRGAVVTDQPLNSRWLRYRGGPDDGWRQIGETLPNGFRCIAAKRRTWV